jgi:hypothetical protein
MMVSMTINACRTHVYHPASKNEDHNICGYKASLSGEFHGVVSKTAMSCEMKLG